MSTTAPPHHSCVTMRPEAFDVPPVITRAAFDTLDAAQRTCAKCPALAECAAEVDARPRPHHPVSIVIAGRIYDIAGRIVRTSRCPGCQRLGTWGRAVHCSPRCEKIAYRRRGGPR